ncbi:MAG: RluA family pseudouridine synthase [Eubacteriales bacterium]|nr:RluA family pseudouridine synthase [Eubacteriales bacterium]
MKISFEQFNWEKSDTATSDWNADLNKASLVNQMPTISIVYEDEWLLVVDKPAGLAVQSDRAGHEHLISHLAKYRPGQSLFLVHRLDLPVSGLVVLAKTATVQTHLTKQMATKTFIKVYRAIVWGDIAPNCGVITDYIKHDEQTNHSQIVTSTHHTAKIATLQYEKIAHSIYRDHPISLLAIRLETGRHHQIRVQLSHKGWPIVGDRKYALNNGNTGRDQGIKWPALQAWTIRFNHPYLNQIMSFSVNVPQMPPWNQFDLSHMCCNLINQV